MGNLFQVLLSSIKAKITPIWTKIKLFTNWSFLRTRVFTQIRKFFVKIFNIKPKDSKDYYGIGRWLVSKRLAFALVIGIGVLSAYYVFFVNPPSVFQSSTDGIKTYSYSSIPLRFAKGRVRIKAKSGYVAYDGEVKKGFAEGKGNLYDREGNTIYAGDFSSSKYNGQGIMYYPTGVMLYDGTFADNLFEGEGTLYAPNGTVAYIGSFSRGLKDGPGQLMDSAGNLVFTGNFSKDGLLYSDFLGKSSQDAGQLYSGQQDIYLGYGYMLNYMKDIQALYYGSANANNLEDTIPIDGVYVLKDYLRFGGTDYMNIVDVKQLMGAPVYEGNAYLIMPEAVALQILASQGNVSANGIELDLKQDFDNSYTVGGYNSAYEVYIYSFDKDGIRYSFFASAINGDFYMYQMELLTADI